MTPTDEAELRELATEPNLSHMGIAERIDGMPDAQRRGTLQLLRNFREALKNPHGFIENVRADSRECR